VSRPFVRLELWILRHLEALFGTLRDLLRRPLASLMTATVIGIALALPTGLYLLLGNLQRIATGWDATPRISLFLHQEVTDEQATRLAASLRGRTGAATVQLITKEEALAEFTNYSGFGDALKALDQNPLPAVLVVQPQSSDPQAAEVLLDKLKSLPEVEQAQLDMAWLKRLHAVMAVGQQAVLVLAGLLGAAVLLVIGNTIRLTIQNRRDEVVVLKLIGGSDAFIRRPFLYTGLWYGLLGGSLALALVHGSIYLLAEPIDRLAILYSSAFRLSGPDTIASLTVLGSGIGLGWVGAWLAVGRHLREIEPS